MPGKLLQRGGFLLFALLFFSLTGMCAGRSSPPTPTPLLESIRIERRYPLEVEGEVLEDNPWREYYAPEFSPDGQWMLFRKPVIGGDELWITDSQGKNARRLLEKVRDYAWSPDGKWIAYTQPLPEPLKGASLWVIRADGTSKKKLAESLKTGRVEWTRDNRLVYLATDGPIMSISQDGKQIRFLTPSVEVIRFSISPDGHYLAIADETDVWLVDLKKPDVLRKITPYAGAYSGIRGGLAWSPDNRYLSFASD